MDADACVRELPELCTRIILFDMLIANQDRHPRNAKVDDPVTPTDIDLFDHDRALFGARRGQALKTLETREPALGIGLNHCLAKAIDTCEFIPRSIEQAASVPKNFIHDVCQEASGLGITTDEANAARDFLRRRQDSLQSLVRQHQRYFSKITHWDIIL